MKLILLMSALCMWATVSTAQTTTVVVCQPGLSFSGPPKCGPKTVPYVAQTMPSYTYTQPDVIEWQVSERRHYVWCQFVARGQFVCQ